MCYLEESRRGWLFPRSSGTLAFTELKLQCSSCVLTVSQRWGRLWAMGQALRRTNDQALGQATCRHVHDQVNGDLCGICPNWGSCTFSSAAHGVIHQEVAALQAGPSRRDRSQHACANVIFNGFYHKLSHFKTQDSYV